jgi:peptide/nickel transport system substrate-binding protein
MHIKPEQREVLRNRVFVGSALMSVWTGLENAIPTPETSPEEIAPTSQHQLHWPKWGQYHESGGLAGEAPDTEPAKELMRLNDAWVREFDPTAKADIWHEMLKILADEVFTIGTVRGVPQPVVVANNLRNVPEEGVYNWEPGAYFGVYNPDTFWFDQRP